jgi:hypothetical protein
MEQVVPSFSLAVDGDPRVRRVELRNCVIVISAADMKRPRMSA